MFKVFNLKKKFKALSVITMFIFTFSIIINSLNFIMVQAEYSDKDYDLIVKVGEKFDLAANVENIKGQVFEAKKIKWSSDNKKIASVSGSGTITGISEGIANITAVDSEGTHIKQAVFRVKIISLIDTIKFYDIFNNKELDSVNVYIGGKATVKYRIYLKPQSEFKELFGSKYKKLERKLYFQELLNTSISSTIENKKIIRSVSVKKCDIFSNNSINGVTVYSGIIEINGGYEEGLTKITVSTKDGNKKDNLSCNVKSAVENVFIRLKKNDEYDKEVYEDVDKIYLCVGEKKNLKALIQSKYKNIQGDYCKKVKWSVDDKNIATVSSGSDNTSTVTGKKAGKTTVKVLTTDGEKEDSIEVYVISMIKGIEIEEESKIIQAGVEPYALEYKVIPKDFDEIYNEIKEIMGEKNIDYSDLEEKYEEPFNINVKWSTTVEGIEERNNKKAVSIKSSRTKPSADYEYTGEIYIKGVKEGNVKVIGETEDGGYSDECIFMVPGLRKKDEEKVEQIKFNELKPAKIGIESGKIANIKYLDRKEIYCGDTIPIKENFQYSVLPKTADDKNVKLSGNIYSDSEKKNNIGVIKSTKSYKTYTNDKIVWVLKPEHEGVYEVIAKSKDGNATGSKDIAVKTMLRGITMLTDKLEKDENGDFFIYQGQGIDKKKLSKPVYIGYILSAASYIGDEEVKLKDIKKWESDNTKGVRVSPIKVSKEELKKRNSRAAELKGYKAGEETVITAITRDNEFKASIKVKVKSMADSIKIVDEKGNAFSDNKKELKLGIGAKYEPKVKINPKKDLAYGYRDVLDKEYSCELVDEKVEKNFIIVEKSEVEKEKNEKEKLKKVLVEKMVKYLNEKETKLNEKNKYLTTLDNAVIPDEVKMVSESILSKDREMKSINEQLSKIKNIDEFKVSLGKKKKLLEGKERLMKSLQSKKAVNTQEKKEKLEKVNAVISDCNEKVNNVYSEYNVINGRIKKITTIYDEYAKILEKYKDQKYIPVKNDKGKYLKDRNGKDIKVIELSGKKLTGRRRGNATFKVKSNDGGYEDKCTVSIDDKIEKMIIVDEEGNEIAQSRMPIFSDEEVVKRKYNGSVRKNTKDSLTIKFNNIIDLESIYNNQWAIYVTDSEHYEVEANVRIDTKDISGKTILIEPKKAFTYGEYYIFVTEDVKFKDDKKLEKPIKYTFIVK